MNFGEHIKKIRTEKGLSMRELERRSGLSQSYISQLEKGIQQNPKNETIQKLALGLNTDYQELLRKAGHVDSLIAAFGLREQRSPYENLTTKEGLTASGSDHEEPINDLFFHLNDKTNQKYYKYFFQLTEQDREEIKKMIEDYLLKKVSSEEYVDRELIKVLLDENYKFPHEKE